MAQPQRIDWVASRNGQYPKFPMLAGIDSGKELYVARANHNGGTIPGKFMVSHKSAYIAFNGLEVPKDEYEILVAPAASLSWVDAQGGNIPPHAVPGGRDPSGEVYYIGRVWLNNTITVGKIHPSHGKCYVPYGGKEHAIGQFEILIKNALGRALNI